MTGGQYVSNPASWVGAATSWNNSIHTLQEHPSFMTVSSLVCEPLLYLRWNSHSVLVLSCSRPLCLNQCSGLSNENAVLALQTEGTLGTSQ